MMPSQRAAADWNTVLYWLEMFDPNASVMLYPVAGGGGGGGGPGGGGGGGGGFTGGHAVNISAINVSNVAAPI